VLNDRIVRELRILDATIRRAASAQREELERREHAYRGARQAAEVEGRVVILVDDGLAPGTRMRAAIAALRERGPAWIVAAAPVGEAETCALIHHEADEFVCARMPMPFVSVGVWYSDYRPLREGEIHDMLEGAARRAYRPMPALAEI
jgi:predicted phosphoribosyltransferase